MDRDEICKTMHISSSFRRVASTRLLFQLDISQSEVQTRTVKLALSDSLHLIVFVAHICPIQRLECFENSGNMPATEFQRLTLILGAVAPIPDIYIYDRLKQGQWKDFKSRPRSLLTNLPQTATDTLLVVWDDSIHLSRPSLCGGPSPPDWLLPRPESGPMIVQACALMVTLPIYAVLIPVNSCLLLGWVFRRVLGHKWSTAERISKDIHLLASRGDIRVQSLSTKYTVMTCKQSVWDHFFIMPLRGVPDAVHSLFLASLDLKSTNVTVESGSNVAFADLVTFVARHENLLTLACAPNSIRPSSLKSTLPSHISSKIVHLGAPASYIPHLLPLTPRVERVYLSFPSISTWLSMLSIGPPVFDYTAYCTALTAIAQLMGSRVHAMSLTFDLTATNLPWQPGASKEPQPETQLHGVEHLMLCTIDLNENICRAATIRALTPWLARFPSLRRVSFEKVEGMWYDEACELKDGIVAVCPQMNGAEHVLFEIEWKERIGNDEE
ncbi:hypothetical protein FB45DRAFT_1018660 [Roridomyces roridus]|uniref:Uncharacterized protein n=1 Tax=Roridomyces roridus TaxID=1738132 RepID=A0AAD7CL54_9AGAR|nr:hypothetical protein FB45DRAFT_1018660 [Roridomyces roridus]